MHAFYFHKYLQAIIISCLIMVYVLAGRVYLVLEPGIFLTIHQVLEFASIVVAMLVCILCWYDFRNSSRRKMLVLALTFLLIGLFDFVHTLSYLGMPDFITPNTANKASTCWVIARLVQGLGLLAAVFWRDRLVRIARPVTAILLCFFIAGLIIWAVATELAHLPIMYDPVHMRQTHLKMVSECFIILLYLLAAVKIYINKSGDIRDVYLFYALVVGIFGELAFAAYSVVYDSYNFLGHILKLMSFSLILKGLFEEAIVELYKTNAVLAQQRGELTEANRLLKESDQLKDNFLANTNHELRSPLTAIIAFTELLLDKETGPLNPLQKDYINEISDSGSDLLNRVNEIGDLSRIKAGKMLLNMEKTSIKEVVMNTARRLKPQFENKGIDLKINIAADLPAVYADKGRLGQILANLLGNAIKFTPPGGWVGVDVAEEREDNKIKVTVADNGIGINPGSRPLFLKCFTRWMEPAHASTVVPA